MKSIRRYLLRSLILLLLVISLLTIIFTYFDAEEGVYELYDKNMQELAKTMQSQLVHFDKPDTTGHYAVSATRLKLRGEEEYLIQVWKNEKLFYSTHPAIHLPLLASDAMKNEHGIFTSLFQNREWLVYQQLNEHGIIQIAQPKRARSDFIREIAIRMLIPTLIQIPLLCFLIWFTVGKSLRPLAAISEGIKKRSASSLEAFPIEQTPVEILPVVQELNAMMGRLSEALQAQRRFIADAAHELRTPLTALQLQLSVLERAKSETERANLATKLQDGIVRATHLVQQLLTLARLEPEAVTRQHQSVALLPIARSVAEAYADMAASKKIDLGFPRIEEVTIHGDAEALRILLSNLVDNALRFTAIGGHIDISIYAHENATIIEVEDNGIGIPESQRAMVFERFQRVLGTNVEGTGLGLAIVKNIVETHGGSACITTGKGGKGICVKITLPIQNH